MREKAAVSRASLRLTRQPTLATTIAANAENTIAAGTRYVSKNVPASPARACN